MKLNNLAKLLLINDNVYNGPGGAKHSGRYIFEDEKRKITLEFVNNKKNKISIYLNYYGKIEKLTIDEFLNELNFSRKPFIEKIINIVKQLSIKYYQVDIGFKKTVEALFNKKRPQSDISLIANFFIDSDIFISANGKVIYDNEELNLRKNKQNNNIAKDLLSK